MKKYIILFSLTSAILLFSFFLNQSQSAQIPTIETCIAEHKTVKDTIVAKGTLINKNSVNFEYSIPLSINKIFVKEGDYVTPGDVLFSVNREKTIDYLLNSGALSMLSGGFDYTNVTNLPEQIYSTSGGYVTSVNYISGAFYDTLNPVITISEKEDIVANVAVSESFISKIKVGQTATVKCPAISNKSIKGVVSKIGNNATVSYKDNGASDNTVSVEIELDTDVVPKLGYSLTATINLDTHKAVILPYNTLSQDDEGEYVYILKTQNFIEKRYIKTKKDYSTGSEVDEDLGGAILVSNPEVLKSDEVRIIEE